MAREKISEYITDEGVVKKKDIAGNIVTLLCIFISIGLIALGILAYIG